jgi:hypothetical protein
VVIREAKFHGKWFCDLDNTPRVKAYQALARSPAVARTERNEA